MTECVDGGTLQEWSGRKQTWRKILELLIGVADGLSAAHAAEVIHRDIKPANILVSSNGYAKLGDFGVAKLVEGTKREVTSSLIKGETRTGTIVGTLAYMSPEQASGGLIDRRSDVFSFGVVLYEMLAGHRPFLGTTDREILLNILRASPTPLPRHIPVILRLAVEKALEKDPSDRYQAISEMVVDLKRVQRLHSGGSLDEGLERQHLGRWQMAVLCLLLLIAAGIYWKLKEADYFWRNPLAGARAERLTDFEGEETNAAISPDGKLFSFLAHRQGQFDAWASQISSSEFVNITNGRFHKLGPGPIRRVGFSHDGVHIWLVDGEGAGPYVTWRYSPWELRPRPFLASGMEPAWSPDGSQIVYHTAAPGDPIFIADRTGSDPRLIFTERPGGHCHYLTWSPDGRFIYFVRGNPSTEQVDIWRISIPQRGTPAIPERITRYNARIAYLDWLDERTLIYSGAAEDGSGQWLYAMDVRRRVPHRVSPGITEQYLSVAVSPTRPQRLVVSVANPSASLWTVPLAEHTQSEADVNRFPVPKARALNPRFASDYFLFLSSTDGRDGLWKLENGVISELWKGSEGGIIASPSISPDGREICFSYRKRGRTGLHLMSADGMNIRALAESLDVSGAASWSPDRRWVAVGAKEGEGTYVFKVPVDGGAPIRLVDAYSYNPIWSPDGKLLIYSEPLQGGSSVTKAIRPDKTAVPFPAIQLEYTSAAPYRFVQGGKALIVLKGGSSMRKDFYGVDLETGRERQLTDLKMDAVIEHFDVTPDSKQIVFDRVRNNSDLFLLELRQ